MAGHVFKYRKGEPGRVQIGEDLTIRVEWDESGERVRLHIEQRPRYRIVALKEDIDTEPDVGP